MLGDTKKRAWFSSIRTRVDENQAQQREALNAKTDSVGYPVGEALLLRLPEASFPVDSRGPPTPVCRRMDRNLALEVVRVTEAAALAAARFVGRGDEVAADLEAARAIER